MRPADVVRNLAAGKAGPAPGRSQFWGAAEASVVEVVDAPPFGSVLVGAVGAVVVVVEVVVVSAGTDVVDEEWPDFFAAFGGAVVVVDDVDDDAPAAGVLITC